jgi:four helix bundle protein
MVNRTGTKVMINDLEDRTKRFATDVVRFCSTLNGKPEIRIISNQLVRAGTSVGANYRAACRSKSKADFINKLSIVEEEADESEYWFELLESLATPKNPELLRLKDEAHQLVAIMIQSKKTARASFGATKTGNSPFSIRNS